MKRRLPLLILVIAGLPGACAQLREKPMPPPLTAMSSDPELVLLGISPTAAELIVEYTGHIEASPSLTRYMDSIGHRIETSVNAKLSRYKYGLVVSFPIYGIIHTPRFMDLLPTLLSETGLQIYVVGNSVFTDASPQCMRVKAVTREAVIFLSGHGIMSPRMLSYVECDEIPSITFDKDDPQRDERLEFVLYPRRSLIESITKADGPRSKPKN